LTPAAFTYTHRQHIEHERELVDLPPVLPEGMAMAASVSYYYESISE